MNKILKALIFVTLFPFSGPQPALAASIYVGVTAPDPVGKSLVYDLKERIASSSRNKLVIDEGDAAFKILIVTLDPDDSQKRTIYSVVLNMKNYSEGDNFDYFLTSWVGSCGISMVESCARNLASSIDAEMQPIVEELLKLLKGPMTEKKNESF